MTKYHVKHLAHAVIEAAAHFAPLTTSDRDGATQYLAQEGTIIDIQGVDL